MSTSYRARMKKTFSWQPAILAMWMGMFTATTSVSARSPKEDLDTRQPLDFRCDGMHILTQPNRSICRGNVVIRRPDILLCCNRFEGFADKDWEWQRFICLDDVRAIRTGEAMWANRAEMEIASYDLILTGVPLLQRGKNLMHGDRVVVNIKSDKARIENPRGQITTSRESAPPAKERAFSLDEPLPSTCPIPKRP